MDVPINIGARFAVKGIVTDMLGNPIENAEIRNTQGSVAYTDFNGVFCFYTVPGDYSMTACSDNSLDRKFRVVVSALADDNDFTSVAIQLCDYEYVKDGIINAKDYAVLKKVYPEKDEEREYFSEVINFTANEYPELNLRDN